MQMLLKFFVKYDYYPPPKAYDDRYIHYSLILYIYVSYWSRITVFKAYTCLSYDHLALWTGNRFIIELAQCKDRDVVSLAQWFL